MPLVRGEAAGIQVNDQAALSSPALGRVEISSAVRALWTTIEKRTLPRVVVTVPVSSASQRSSVQSTSVTSPARVRSKWPMGSRE
ncbi:hypothetical protein ACWGLG_10705 [Streptomyces antimycoticus]